MRDCKWKANGMKEKLNEGRDDELLQSSFFLRRRSLAIFFKTSPSFPDSFFICIHCSCYFFYFALSCLLLHHFGLMLIPCCFSCPSFSSSCSPNNLVMASVVAKAKNTWEGIQRNNTPSNLLLFKTFRAPSRFHLHFVLLHPVLLLLFPFLTDWCH